MKNKTIAVFALMYVLFASTYSIIPSFADNHDDIITSILDGSINQIEEKN